MGLGHMHRLLALGEMLHQHFNVIFITRAPLAGIRSLILQTCSQLIELAGNTLQDDGPILTELFTGHEIIVLDGYHFDTSYQKKLRGKVKHMVCIDDIHAYPFIADTIINPAGGVTKELYQLEESAEFLAGPSYAFIKGAFIKAGALSEKELYNHHVLICMGGADPHNFTLEVLQHCLIHPTLSFSVVIGEAYAHKEILLEFASSTGRTINIASNLTPEALAALMLECNVAVCSASGISYEYSSVGGELYVIQTADNQELLKAYLIRAELAFNFQEFRVTDKVRVNKVLHNQKRIFDGQASRRFLNLFHRIDFQANVSIRQATPQDAVTLFDWTNEPETRKQSFNTATIPWDDHVRWLHGKLANKNCRIFILQHGKTPIAMVRFELQNEAIMSYSLDKSYRGKGWGKYIVMLGLDALRKDQDKALRVLAFVKKDNFSSNKIFTDLNFDRREATEYPYSYKYELNLV